MKKERLTIKKKVNLFSKKEKMLVVTQTRNGNEEVCVTFTFMPFISLIIVQPRAHALCKDLV